MSDTERLECAKCNTPLPGISASPGVGRQPCPQCGSTEQILRLEFFDEAKVTPRDRLKIKVKDNRFPSKKMVRQEIIHGFDERRSRGDYVHKEREIDRDEDSYRELIREETGEIIHSVEEKLSDHFGHGSDKFPKKPVVWSNACSPSEDREQP